MVYDLTYGSLFIEEQRRIASNAPPTKLAFLKGLFAGGLFGLGGGAAVILAAISLNKFDMKSSDENILYLIVLGVVAGFVGYRILPQVARGLERRMDITEKDARHALAEAKNAASEAKVAREKAEKAQKVTSAISLIESKNFRNAEKTLLDLRKTDRLDHLVYFKLANMYKREGDYKSAIDITNQYIEDLRAENKESGEEYTVALYNRACYTTRMAFSSGRDDLLIVKALDDLKRALDLGPGRREFAWKDDDFERLKEERNARFAEIVGREYAKIPESGAGKS